MGVRYCAYGTLLAYGESGPRGDAVQVPPPDRRNSFAQRLFAPLPERYDRLAELLSFGQNGRWRRAMVGHVVPASPNGQSGSNGTNGQAGQAGQLILDVAAGTAGITLQL